jgi:hypothetical protein
MVTERRQGLSRHALLVFAWITIAFWASTAFFPQRIPPLGPWPDLGGALHGLPEWIRQLAGLDGPEPEIASALERELLKVYALQWLTICAGVTSGALLLRRRRAGRVLAVTLSAALLGSWMISQVQKLFGPDAHFVAYWTVTPRVAPWTFLSWMLHVAFYTATLVVLLSTRGDTPAPQDATALTEVFR